MCACIDVCTHACTYVFFMCVCMKHKAHDADVSAGTPSEIGASQKQGDSPASVGRRRSSKQPDETADAVGESL